MFLIIINGIKNFASKLKHKVLAEAGVEKAPVEQKSLFQKLNDKIIEKITGKKRD